MIRKSDDSCTVCGRSVFSLRARTSFVGSAELEGMSSRHVALRCAFLARQSALTSLRTGFDQILSALMWCLLVKPRAEVDVTRWLIMVRKRSRSEVREGVAIKASQSRDEGKDGLKAVSDAQDKVRLRRITTEVSNLDRGEQERQRRGRMRVAKTTDPFLVCV